MAIYASDKGGTDFKPVPADVHDAVCVWMVDLGLQPGTPLYPANKHQVYIKWEIPGERIEYERDGQKHEGPMTIGNFYTVSLSEKANLRSHLEGWRGKPFTSAELAKFDITTVVGKPCRLVVKHKTKADGRVVAIVESILKAKVALVPESETIIGDGDHSGGLQKLPDWLKEKIAGQVRPESRDDVDERMASGVEPFADDIPFRQRHWQS